MAKEIQTLHTTAKTLYAQVLTVTGSIWNTAGTPAFEAYATANIADYDVALTEQGTASGLYMGDFPSGIAAGTYHVVVYDRAGGAPAETDTMVATGTIHWTGSAAVSYSATRGLAGTALPNAAADAAGGLPVSDAGGLDLDNLPTSTRNAIRDLYGIAGTVDDVSPAAGDFDAAAGLSATDDFYINMVLVFTSGTLAGVPRTITGYTGLSRNFQFADPFPAAPANGDTFMLIGRIEP